MKAEDLREDLSGGNADGPPSTPRDLDVIAAEMREAVEACDRAVQSRISATQELERVEKAAVQRVAKLREELMDAALGMTTEQRFQRFASGGYTL